jgi:hypothetical protein
LTWGYLASSGRSKSCYQVTKWWPVVLALMLGRPAERYLDAQRAAHLRRMHELTELKRAGPLMDTLDSTRQPGSASRRLCSAGGRPRTPGKVRTR